MRLSITQKLISVIIVLVIAPILATGLMANRTAKQIVTRLLNESQITLAREIAEQVGQLFKTAQADIQILSALPALSDYYYHRFYNLHSEAAISRDQIQTFFMDMAKKSEFYYSICYLNAQGLPIATITQGRIMDHVSSQTDVRRPIEPAETQTSATYVSPVLTLDADHRRVVRFSHPLFDVWNNLSGIIRLEVDFDQISQRILSRRVGQNGYALVVDTQGRIQIHPERQNDRLAPVLKDLVSRMLKDRQGMASYAYYGHKVAAFTPVEQNGWIVAVTLPESEFAEQVTSIAQQMLLIVIVAASIAVGVGILFSWRFVRPIKQLAQATNEISSGGLPSQLESSSHDELGILTRSFNHMVRNLRQVQAELIKSEKLVSLGRLATGVAHEIRNPLNDMKVAAEILYRQQPTAEEARELVKLISDEIDHLDSFVTHFLSYALQPPLRMIECDLNQLIEDIVHTAQPRMEKHNIELAMQLDTDLPTTGMDPFQMERALINIIANAIDAMPQSGQLTVRTFWVVQGLNALSRPTLQIWISDSGVGLSAEQLGRVFDPFFSTKDHGTGLGLSLTKSIVEAHGGTISVQSNNGPGLTVKIELPVTAGPLGEEKPK